MKIFRSGTFVALLLALAAVASAQQTTGTLTGRLQDSQGLALPGVNVTVTGQQGAKSAVTDTDGSFRIPFLTPGTYDVRAELQGFKTVEQRGVSVSLGQVTTVNMQLEVGGLTEVVQVTGSTAIVDTTSTTTGAVLTAELMQRVPVGRRFTDTLYLAPGVSSSGAAGSANPSVSGSSGLDNLYVVDGINVTNTGYGAIGSYSTVFGSLGTATPFDFVQEVQVKTGGYEAEFGQAMGGVVNVITKSGSNALRGSMFGYTQPAAVEAGYKTYQSLNGTVNTVGQQRSDVGVEGGFPILRNKLFFFGAINPAWETRTFVAPDGFPLVSLGEVDRKRQITSYSAKGTYQLASAHRIDASFFGDPAKGDMGAQRTSSLTVDDTSSFSELEYGGHNQTVRYDGIITPTWLVEGAVARAYNKIAETPSVNEWRVTDTTVVPQRISGGIGGYEAGNESLNLQYTAKTTLILGGHQLKAGFTYEDVEYSQVNQRTGPTFVAADGRTTATGASISIIADPTLGRIYRVTRANFNSDRLTTQAYSAFFVQDTWRVAERLTINPGLRYEQQTLKGTFQTLTTLDGQQLDDFSLSGNWAPRIGAVYDLVGNGKSKLYGNWGRFFARVPNDLAARALSADDGFSRGDYYDAGLTRPIPNGILAGGQTNHFVIAGAGADQIDPDTKLSYKDEIVAGFEYEAFPNINLGVRYIHRGIGRILEDIADAPAVAYDLGLPGLSSVEYILTNPDSSFPTRFPELNAHFEDPTHSFNAIEFTFDRRFVNNWSLLGSYRWSRLHGSYEGFFREDNGQSDPGITSLYDFPTNDPSYTAIGVPIYGYRGDIRYLGALGEGPLPLDRPHAFKLSGNRAFDNGLSFGVGFNMSSGKPLTAMAALAPYDNDSEIPMTPRGEGFDTVDGFKTRTPFETQLDMQASYSINAGAARRLTLLADVFNLFNIRRVTDYNAAVEYPSFGVDNPDFGTPTSANVAGQQYQRPFTLRLGARFAF
ncbi:MAG TPA: TonB-dependent receptor [Vicinamibacterales bacterium]|jgi:outer membrane receptor protein involved in Fe transport|nr:TonB-dependent receptor [Vicinamibacterales bacterium]